MRSIQMAEEDKSTHLAGFHPKQTQITEYVRGTAEMPKQESGMKEHMHDSETNTERLDAIIQFLETSEELDIYQLVAFRVKSGNRPRQNGACWGYYIDIVKALIIMLTQITSIGVLYLKIFHDREKGYCEGEGEFEARVMATCYSAFLAMMIFTTFANTSNAGFYLHLSYEKKHYKFISSSWLHFGRTINEMGLIASHILSFYLILMTDDPLDMLLNSIALLFITEIDNVVIDSSDYLKVLSWFKNIKQKAQTYSNGDDYIDDIFETKKMNVCLAAVYNIVFYATVMTALLVMVGSPALPVIMYMCY